MTKITVEHVAEAGIVGAGGAGFPTHFKLTARADTVLINAAECEPLLHKDKEVLREFADLVLEGLAAAMRLVGAKRGIVGVKAKYRDVIERLRPMLGSAMEIVPLRDAYPAGDEMLLVYECLGRVVAPGAIPLSVGAVVMNVETARNVALAPRQPVTEKFLTIAGAVVEPVTLRVPLGISLGECLHAAGGANVSDPCYLIGGVMMGSLLDDLDTVVDKTTGGLVVLPSDHGLIRRRMRDSTQIARIGRSACDQCSFCTELCPRWLLGHPIEPHRAMRSLGFNLVGEPNVAGTAFCCECNLCSLYSCPEGLDPKSVCSESKRRLAERKERWDDPPLSPRRAEQHMENRKAPTSRLMQKLGLGRFRNVGLLRNEPLTTDKVGIPLKQHVGVPCQPTVSPGERVTVGQVVGHRPIYDGMPALGAPIHASIDGVVTAIEGDTIWIERN